MTSETGWSDADDMKPSASETMENSVGLRCTRHLGSITTGLLSVLAFLSPIAMVILPQVVDNIEYNLTNIRCPPTCQGYFISFSFKLIVLAIGAWALFFRRAKASMPRVFVFQALVLSLLFILTFAYWLFYIYRIVLAQNEDKTTNYTDYTDVVQFASSMVDSLLFVHYIAIVLVEIRQLQTMYCIKVIRSPDGETHT